MSETPRHPRTDAQIARTNGNSLEYQFSYLVDHAKQLERELQDAIGQLASFARGVKISIPTDVMKMEFQQHYSAGYKAAKAEFTVALSAAEQRALTEMVSTEVYAEAISRAELAEQRSEAMGVLLREARGWMDQTGHGGIEKGCSVCAFVKRLDAYLDDREAIASGARE